MRASHKQRGFVAAMLHRLSGIALAIFLPLHFLALATALNGAKALDSFLALTRNPLVEAAEFGLVLVGRAPEVRTIADRRATDGVDGHERADEFFITNAVRGIRPVGFVEGLRTFVPGPTIQRLREATESQ